MAKVTIQATDVISTSRTDINSNFTELYDNKIETSYLDTDTTLAANSDSKIATQKAVKTYVDASVNPTGRSWNEYAADAGSTDSYAITVSGVSAYVTGQTFKFKANTANTGACTLNVSALGAKTIKKDVTTDLATGDILANQIVKIVYDGTNFQIVSPLPSISPTIQTYTLASRAVTSYGSVTTRFDITNPSGTTFRYTWDSTGTDPNINTTTFAVGKVVSISSSQISYANNGTFIITGSGTNYFEVTNASGVAEVDKIINTNGFVNTTDSVVSQTWTKPTGLKYVVVEVQGAGGAGQTAGANNSGASGSAGGYSKKLISASSLGATETVYVGFGGLYSDTESLESLGGSPSSFGSHLSAQGGGMVDQANNDGGIGGTATGGDLNIQGGDGNNALSGTQDLTPNGADSMLGSGGHGAISGVAGKAGRGYGSGGGGGWNSTASGVGANGIVIVTEYY